MLNNEGSCGSRAVMAVMADVCAVSVACPLLQSALSLIPFF
jgi:hypothetical protein